MQTQAQGNEKFSCVCACVCACACVCVLVVQTYICLCLRLRLRLRRSCEPAFRKRKPKIWLSNELMRAEAHDKKSYEAFVSSVRLSSEPDVRFCNVFAVQNYLTLVNSFDSKFSYTPKYINTRESTLNLKYGSLNERNIFPRISNS